ncbi:MAG: hypothetical protein QOF11_2370 [Chloroflexota bacterium]|jgi:hypothetical protein|nr:hypothetical protein [Chloroflexota bacterium]
MSTMPFGDYQTYLGHIDVIWALLLAAGGVVIAVAAYLFVQAALSDILSALPHLGGRLTRTIRTRHEMVGPEWVCRDCRSINAPGSMACYRGCGRRYFQEDVDQGPTPGTLPGPERRDD